MALINSVGNVGGFMGPFLVGWIKDSTGSFNNGLYALAGFMVLAAVVTVAGVQATAAEWPTKSPRYLLQRQEQITPWYPRKLPSTSGARHPERAAPRCRRYSRPRRRPCHAIQGRRDRPW